MSYEDEDQIAVVCPDVQGIHKIHSIFHYLQSSVPHCWQHIILTFSGGAVFITPVLNVGIASNICCSSPCSMTLKQQWNSWRVPGDILWDSLGCNYCLCHIPNPALLFVQLDSQTIKNKKGQTGDYISQGILVPWSTHRVAKLPVCFWWHW